ncbi:MAG: hypothetical protein IPH37_13340 [Burkholderiales bacterium]|nr:hypothetical protein [Burkholderiales bacterium]
MNALSPGPYIFWTLVTGPILVAGWRESPLYGIGFLGGFYLTIVCSLAGIIVVFGLAARFGQSQPHHAWHLFLSVVPVRPISNLEGRFLAPTCRTSIQEHSNAQWTNHEIEPAPPMTASGKSDPI